MMRAVKCRNGARPIVSQHSGEGKANQYTCAVQPRSRFRLLHHDCRHPGQHATGAHAHGYADASFLIPELVSGVQFKKGPYFADEGDFSAAGAANVNYVNRLDAHWSRFSGGNDGWGRLLAAASPPSVAATCSALSS